MTTGRINQVTISICTEIRNLCTALVLVLKTLTIAGVHYKAGVMPFVNSFAVEDSIPSIKTY